MPQVLLNLDSMDDPLMADGTLSFTGGMVSNEEPSLLAEVESSYLLNCERTRQGKLTTRMGTVLLGGGAPPGGGPIIQGMAYYWSGTNSYLVVASGGKLYRESGSSWVQIATGGLPDNAPLDIYKLASINAVLAVGATTIPVAGLTGPVAINDIFFLHKDIGYNYVVTGHTETAGNTTSVTIAAPGLVVSATTADPMHFKRLGAQTNGAAAPGAATIAIDGITGALANSDWVVSPRERVIHLITAHTESVGNTTSVTLNPPIRSAYVGPSTTNLIVFALGNEKLFWTDGTGPIYSWDGTYTADLSYPNPIDDFLGGVGAPTGAKWIAWFQDRLIAAAPTSDDEGLWFSDFGDPTSWDQNFQQMDVGGGESDPIQAIVPWLDQNLVVFKAHSIYVVNMDPSQNPDPTDPTLLVASYGVKLLTHYLGASAPHTIAQVGGPRGDLFFLGTDRKLRSLRRTLAAETQQETGDSLSFKVQDIFDRITAAQIQNCTAFYWNNRYIISMPLDGQVQPNATYVYNTSLDNWNGEWKNWLPTAYGVKLLSSNNQVLVIGQSNNTVLQWLGDTGAATNVPSNFRDQSTEIETAILTRSYTFQDLFNVKTGLQCAIEIHDNSYLPYIVDVSIIIDQSVSTGSAPLVGSFDPSVYIRKELDLQRFGQWREAQLYIYTPAHKLGLRLVKITGFIDTIQLQTLIDTPGLNSPMPSS